MSIKIFISHSSEDQTIAQLVVDIIEKSLIMPEEIIRCTSLDGYQLASGTHTSTTLRDEIINCQVIIGILTPNSLASGWVAFELGAAWGQKKWVIPLLAYGLNYSDIPGPLQECHALLAADRANIEQMLDELAKRLQIVQRPRAKANKSIVRLAEEAQKTTAIFTEDAASNIEDDLDLDEQSETDTEGLRW